MPRCQRTFRVLSNGIVDATTGAARWRCPHCPDAEVYETVRASDLLQYAELALTACCRDFGPPDDRNVPTVLFWGLAPECVFEPQERQYHLYLQQGSDPYQARLQIGHEMFHRVCSQGKIFHWTHEMLACLLSVRLLRGSGAEEYADRTEREYLAQSEQCSLETMLAADLSHAPYPPGLYGRAYRIGLGWQEKYGWAALCRLSRALGRKGTPELDVWLAIIEEPGDFLEHGSVFRNL